MRICAPVCFLSLPSAVCKLLLGWCHWAPSYLYSPCARYRELRRPPGGRLCLSVTVAFLRELHAPCISWAFPFNSLAFPERPPYVSFYVDQAMFPWGFLMGSLLHFPGIMLGFLAWILPLAVHFLTAHEPQVSTPQLYTVQINPVLTSPFVVPVPVWICSNASASGVGFACLSPEPVFLVIL